MKLLSMCCLFLITGCAMMPENGPPLSIQWTALEKRQIKLKILEKENRPISGGFSRLAISTPSSSTFESVAHYGYLFYRNHLLGDESGSSISPDGRYAAYFREDGRMEIFDAQTHRCAVVPGKSFLPRAFVWPQGGATLEITGHRKREKAVIQLR